MRFENERQFEGYVRDLLSKYIMPLDNNLTMLKNKKAVDILICKNGSNPSLYFIEIKYHKKKHSRLSTGHGKGGGTQPEILKLQPDYFKTNMRWILGDENIDNYLFIDNTKMVEYAAGGAIGEKYNNIQKRIFQNETLLSESELISAMKKWLLY